jgi:hypothetical protein
VGIINSDVKHKPDEKRRRDFVLHTTYLIGQWGKLYDGENLSVGQMV